MKIRNKVLAFILCLCMIVPTIGNVAHAASGSVKISSASGNVGSTVTITGTVSSGSGAIGAASVVLTYDPSL